MGHIENALNIDVRDLRNNLDKLDFKKDIYINCKSGLRAHLASCIIQRKGFRNKIFNLSGGFDNYKLFSAKNLKDRKDDGGNNSDNKSSSNEINTK